MADSTVVLIEGSLTPAAGYLKRGEQAEVTLTDTIKDLESKGFINYVNEVVQTPEPIPVDPAPAGSSAVPPVGEATPVVAPNQDLVEAGNPAVDNSLVDVNADTAKTATTRTSTKK